MFRHMLTSIETDLEGMKERANAWATGDVDACSASTIPTPKATASRCCCRPRRFVRDLGDELYSQRGSREAEHALATYETTFSLLPMRELVAADGLLAQLAARGYTVTPP